MVEAPLSEVLLASSRFTDETAASASLNSSDRLMVHIDWMIAVLRHLAVMVIDGGEPDGSGTTAARAHAVTALAETREPYGLTEHRASM